MAIIDRWSLYRNIVSSDHLIKWALCNKVVVVYRISKKVSLSNLIWKLLWVKPTFKFVEAANNLTKLVEVGKHFTKLVKFANNFMKFIEFANIFTKIVEYTNNCTKFMGLANNFYEGLRSCEQLYKVRGTRQ